MPLTGAETNALSIDPSTGELIATYPYDDTASVEEKLSNAERAFRDWSKTSVNERCSWLVRLATALRSQTEPLARMMAREMGKPVAQGRAEVEKSAGTCEWYAAQGPQMLQSLGTSVDDGSATIHFRPLGTIFAVMPWNFPVWQVIRSAIPIFLGGNTYVLKHASNVMGSAYLLKDIFKSAGFLDGVFEIVNVNRTLVPKIIGDPRIAAVTLTGGVQAGAQVASQAAASLKKSVLELGGSDPFIVLNDADIDAAVKAGVASRFQNTGQVCIAAKRIILEEGIAPEFTQKFVDAVGALEVGDPQRDTTYIGPMSRMDLRSEMHGQIEAAIDEGAKLLIGGEAVAGDGFYYRPTVLTDVQPHMTTFRQEVFGPAASLVLAKDAEQALVLANDSEFGLAGNIWSADAKKAAGMAAQLNTGGVFVNGYAASDPRVPIGGVKKSGYGRELSYFGLHEFMNIQTVWIDKG